MNEIIIITSVSIIKSDRSLKCDTVQRLYSTYASILLISILLRVSLKIYPDFYEKIIVINSKITGNVVK